ncbi:hypothetical protein OI18_16375 [Flavihumibacter solisilvae]|uniref:Tryptophan synthase beta chain-like PALP domain-containing protein n=1 Tax=Flavihumibacter solisilvae TaxID=1349421 RepID=A0A0C1L0Q0_9BACT|nr:hypothetical protein OI18_16375 [Flavihumibacter solisilvae]
MDTVHSLSDQSVAVNVLRLDKIHSVVSGNKWFKLQKYLKNALESGQKGILTFGGPYSNHIIATAFAASAAGLQSIGIIRGEEARQISGTLKDARSFGMNLVFVSREKYKDPVMHAEITAEYGHEWTIVPEGGQGAQGILGASEILSLVPGADSYSHICCAAGTGTTLAGLASVAMPSQHLVGISSLKGDDTLTGDISAWLGNLNRRFTIFFDYHFGGYAKYSSDLIHFMNGFYADNKIPTDFVYTAKLMYGVQQLLKTGYFQPGSKVLVIHSGGLQGNRSLKAGDLIFSNE